MNRLGALLLTPVGFVVGGLAGQVIGEAFASEDDPSIYRFGKVRPITKRELDWGKNGGIIGAAVGATIVAVLAAEPSTPKQPGALSGAPLQMLGWP